MPFTIFAQGQYSSGGSQQLYWDWRPDISDSTYDFTLESYYPARYGILSTPCSKMRLVMWNDCTYTQQFYNCTVDSIWVVSCQNSPLSDTLFRISHWKGEYDSLCGFINPYNEGDFNPFPWISSPNRIKVEYRGQITLPEKCANWHFSIGGFENDNCGGKSGNIYGKTQGTGLSSTQSVIPNFMGSNIDSVYYLGWKDSIVNSNGAFNRGVYMTSLNTLTAQPCSSPRMINNPLYMLPLNKNCNWNPCMIKDAKDSVVIELADTLYTNNMISSSFFPNYLFFCTQNEKGQSSNGLIGIKYWLGTIPGQTGSNPKRFDPKYNPFDTDSIFSLHPQTGAMQFYTKSVGQPILCFKIKAYRNGIKHSESYYYNQFAVINHDRELARFQPDSISITGASWKNGTIYAAPQIPFSLKFNVLFDEPNAKIRVWHTADTSLPNGATCSLTNNSSDSVHGTFNWTPTILDTGLHLLYILAKDSNCNQSYNQYTQVFTVPVRVGLYPQSIENISNSYLSIFPNPATESIQIESSEKISLVEIYNSTGQKIIRQQFSKLNSVNIQLDYLVPGFYYIIVNNKIRTKLIIHST